MPEGIVPSTTESTPPASPATEPAPLSFDDVGFDGGGTEIDESIFTDLDEVPPAAQPAQAKAPVAPPPVAPTPTEAPAPTPAVAPQTQTEVTPEQVMEAFRGWRQNAEAVLANSHYNLSKEDADQMNVDPGQVIPKFMARVYLDAVTAAVNVISQSLPQAMMNVVDTHTTYRNNETQFFSEWPGLQDHYAEVLRVGQVFRHLNPAASKADFVRSVGAQVAMSLGLTADQARGTKPAQQSGQRVLRHVPPAASARHPVAPQRPLNIFEQMSGEEDE